MTLQVRTDGFIAEVTFSMSDATVVIGVLLLIEIFGTIGGVVLARMVTT